jgi:hypothetical protein
LILDPLTGKSLGNDQADPIPAGSQGLICTVYNSALTATPAGSSQAKWSFAGNALASAPLVVGQQVIVGSSTGNVFILAASDGSLLSSDTLDYPVDTPDQLTAQSPTTGMAAADNRLFVPAGQWLVSY